MSEWITDPNDIGEAAPAAALADRYQILGATLRNARQAIIDLHAQQVSADGVTPEDHADYTDALEGFNWASAYVQQMERSWRKAMTKADPR